MRINWDEFPTDVVGEQAQAPKGCLPQGKYLATIEKSEIKAGWRVNERNPSGDCLSLWIDVIHEHGRYRVFDSIPTNFLGKISAVARAAGVAPPIRGEDWDEGKLQGRRVNIQTGSYVNKAGEENPKIEAYLQEPTGQASSVTAAQATKPAAAKPKPAANTPAQKVEAARQDAGLEPDEGDDIPF
jgi:hypothetical protein